MNKTTHRIKLTYIIKAQAKVVTYVPKVPPMGVVLKYIPTNMKDHPDGIIDQLQLSFKRDPVNKKIVDGEGLIPIRADPRS